MLSSIEICAGAGGQALGLSMAGFEHVALIEYEKDYCDTLKRNRPDWNVRYSERDWRRRCSRNVECTDRRQTAKRYQRFAYGSCNLKAGGLITLHFI